jgi:hypothetical protein
MISSFDGCNGWLPHTYKAPLKVRLLACRDHAEFISPVTTLAAIFGESGRFYSR